MTRTLGDSCIRRAGSIPHLVTIFGVIIKILALLLLLYSPLAIDSDINFAPGINPQDLVKIHPKLKDMVAYIAVFCKEYDIKFVITSAIRTKERNAAVKAVSQTHVEGRAIDFSIREEYGWSPELVWQMTQKVIRTYNQFGAFTNDPKNRQVVIFNHSIDPKEKTHIHLQVYKGLPR